MFEFFLLQPAGERKSSAPVTPAQLSFPGCARASATSLASESTFRLAGTDTATMVLEKRVIGTRSLSL